jgi:hypothetical protein
LGFRVDGLGFRCWYVKVCCTRVRVIDTLLHATPAPQSSALVLFL